MSVSKRSFLVLLFVTIYQFALASPILKVQSISCEALENPMGVDTQQPSLGWKIASAKQGVLQTYYEIQVADSQGKLNKPKTLHWTSGKVKSEESINVIYKGNKLQSGKTYYWRVRIWDNYGNQSAWSNVGSWAMGLLNETDWQAKWIQLNSPTDGKVVPVPLFRKDFLLNKKVFRAKLYITAHGLYHTEINGQPVSNHYFAPGWTSYHKNLAYQIYDVTSLLKDGGNAIGVMLGDGWYRGGLVGVKTERNAYGKEVALLAQLQLDFADGSSRVVATDGSWQTFTDGPIRASDLYNGEIYDATKELKDWSVYQTAISGWLAAREADYGKSQLAADPYPPVTKNERFKPKKITKNKDGSVIVDFGQNLAGWVNFTAEGIKGDSIQLRHAETLDKEGNFYTDNLRKAQQRDVFFMKGGGKQVFEPVFTYHGFRYVEVKGNIKGLDLENMEAVALYAHMPTSGRFETSNSMINQLQHNILWSQKGNFLTVPTDCPQRDERLGWTADAQMFFNTSSFNMDVSGFFKRWLRDFRAEQFKSGVMPNVIPYFWEGSHEGIAGWGDAAVIIPWDHFNNYGDERILQDQYVSMKAWVDYITGKTKNDLWNTGWHFGDWLFYTPTDDRDGRGAITDKYLIAQIFYSNSIDLLAKTAERLGKNEDAVQYRTLLSRVKKAFLKEYVTESGRLVSSTQTAYVLALQFDMLPKSLSTQAAARLVENIRQYGHITTGFLGTPHICQVLSRYGYSDVAYTLLLKDTYPSWLYPVKMGATTVWERWDGIKSDGSFQNTEMNSLNHYGYGAIGNWMYRRITGINPDERKPGYKHIIIAPETGGGLSHASADFESPYGEISTSWELKNNTLSLKLEVPANTTASVVIPKGMQYSPKASGVKVNLTKQLIPGMFEEEVSCFGLGSGQYTFDFEKAGTPVH